MEIRVYDIKDGVTKLGPGKRFCIWTQGCTRRCTGCMTAKSQPIEGGELLDSDWLADRILRSGRTELTISGGEPFLQAKALAEMIRKVRQTVDLGVLIYTGYTIEELQALGDTGHQELLKVCDLLMDGPYVESLNDGMNSRGSSNQRAICLTDRYLEWANEVGTRPAEVEFFFEEDHMSMVGVPSRDILERVKHLFS